MPNKQAVFIPGEAIVLQCKVNAMPEPKFELLLNDVLDITGQKMVATLIGPATLADIRNIQEKVLSF